VIAAGFPSGDRGEGFEQVDKPRSIGRGLFVPGYREFIQYYGWLEVPRSGGTTGHEDPYGCSPSITHTSLQLSRILRSSILTSLRLV